MCLFLFEFVGDSAIVVPRDNYAEKERCAHKGKHQGLNDLLSIGIDVLLTEHGQVDVDVDEEGAEEAAHQADNDGNWDIQ